MTDTYAHGNCWTFLLAPACWGVHCTGCAGQLVMWVPSVFHADYHQLNTRNELSVFPRSTITPSGLTWDHRLTGVPSRTPYALIVRVLLRSQAFTRSLKDTCTGPNTSLSIRQRQTYSTTLLVKPTLDTFGGLGLRFGNWRKESRLPNTQQNLKAVTSSLLKRTPPFKSAKVGRIQKYGPYIITIWHLCWNVQRPLRAKK